MNLRKTGQTVRFALLGLGCRGYSQLKVLVKMPDVEIVSLCDVYPDRVERAQNFIKDARGKQPFGTTDFIEAMDRRNGGAHPAESDRTNGPCAG